MVQSAISQSLNILSQQKPNGAYRTGQRQRWNALDAIPEGRRAIGEGLGEILSAILRQTKLKRAIIAGGDSSSHALGALDIFALKTRYPLTATPGSPLCSTTLAALNCRDSKSP